MDLGLLSEVMASNKICMHTPVFAGLRNLLLANIDGRVSSHYNGEKLSGGFIKMTTDAQGNKHLVNDLVGRADRLAYWGALKPEDRVINLVRLCGPMTRGGDECSYGSMELRDIIMSSADVPQCKGHIILCNTPGGMASCIQDLRMAINYAHDHGQRVEMLIDGICASGGTFASALCDAVYCMNLEDEIGSIGMYCAFFTLADGAENKITSEVYHEYYATKSKDKNGWYRAAAEGDMKLVEKETNDDLEQMLANLKQDRPCITDEQCSGAMYKMKDVIGTLIDGQSNLADMANAMLAEWDNRQGEALPRKEVAGFVPVDEPEPKDDEDENDNDNDNENDNESKCKPEDEGCKPKDDDSKCKPEDGECKPEDDGCKPKEDCNVNENDNENKNVINENENVNENDNENENNETMTQYIAIAAAIGEEPMESLDGRLDLTCEQAEALENLFVAGNNREADLLQQMADANTQHETAIAELNASHSAEIESLNANHASEIETLNTNHSTEIQTLNEQHQAGIAELNTQHETVVAGLNTQLEELRNQLAQLEQQRNDLQATVEELNQASGEQPKAGEQPSNNGAQAPAQPRIVTSSTYDPHVSAEENARRYQAAQQRLMKNR